MVLGRTTASHSHAEPCSPRDIGTLRLKCPNLRLVTRHENGKFGERFTIILTKGRHTGTVRFHQQVDLVPQQRDGQVRAPTIDMPALWQGWIIKHTVGLGVINDLAFGDWDSDMNAVFQNPDRIDRHVSEIQTGWLRFTLTELSAIVTARRSNQNPISRISSAVEVFSMDRLRQFLMMTGKNLYQLQLHTQPHPSEITIQNLPAIVHLVRTQCPKLVQLRLPISLSMDGVRILDTDIGQPPHDLSGPGKIWKLFLLVYGLGQRLPTDLDEVFSWNFARNMALLLSPDFELVLIKGPDRDHKSHFWEQAGLESWGWCPWYKSLVKAIKFFQRYSGDSV